MQEEVVRSEAEADLLSGLLTYEREQKEKFQELLLKHVGIKGDVVDSGERQIPMQPVGGRTPWAKRRAKLEKLFSPSASSLEVSERTFDPDKEGQSVEKLNMRPTGL